MAPQPSRGLTPAQQRERRSKMIAIGLAVVFVVVCVVQGPKLLGGKHATATQTAAPVAPTATAAPNSSDAPVTADPDLAAPIGIAPPGQLTSFTHFAFKDPFVVQVGGATTASSTTGTTTTAAKAPGSTGAETPTQPQSQPVQQPVKQPVKQPVVKKPVKKTVKKPAKKTVKVKPKPVPPNAALIAVGGKNQLVPIGVSFPKQSPLFKLVALNPKLKLIHIGVLDGSFTSGSPTLPVHPGQKITLANETDGSTYVVKLVKLVAATPAQLTAASGTSSSGTAASSSGSSGSTTGSTTTSGTTTATTTTTPTTTTSSTTQGSTTTTGAPPLQSGQGSPSSGK